MVGHTESKLGQTAAESPRKMKKKVSEICNTKYGENNVCCEPSKAEIESAVGEKDLEKRGFQEHLRELTTEWNKGSNFEEYCDCARKYHARRIAFFVVNRWDDPIMLNKDKHTVSEGLHRLKAAIYLHMETVEVEICDGPA
jgi:hypothetical protein